MFGILYFIGILTGSAVSGIKGVFQDAHSVEYGNKLYLEGENPYRFYVDRKGITRLIDTDEPASIEHDYLTGDAWLYIGYPRMKRVRNLSEEWRNRYYRKLFDNPVKGKTTINDIYIRRRPSMNSVKLDESNQWNNSYYAYGQWYLDLRTADKYIKRKLQCIDDVWREFYMRIKDGMLIRITEEEYEKEIENHSFDEDILKETIKTYNKNVKKPNHNGVGWDHEWERFYLDDPGQDYWKNNSDEIKLMGDLAPHLV